MGDAGVREAADERLTDRLQETCTTLGTEVATYLAALRALSKSETAAHAPTQAEARETDILGGKLSSLLEIVRVALDTVANIHGLINDSLTRVTQMEEEEKEKMMQRQHQHQQHQQHQHIQHHPPPPADPRLRTDPRQAVNDPRQAVNDPRQVVNDPRQAINDPRQVVNDPRQVVSDPRQVVSDPRQVVNDPRQRPAASVTNFAAPVAAPSGVVPANVPPALSAEDTVQSSLQVCVVFFTP